MADSSNAPTSASDAEPSLSSAKLISHSPSVRSQMRARPRLPAGPRTRKTTTLGPLKEDHNGDRTPPPQHPPAWTPSEHGSDVQLTNPISPTPVPPTPQPVNLPPLPPPPPPPPPLSHQPDALSPPYSHQDLDDHNITTSRPGTPTPFATLAPSPIGSASRKPSQATVNSVTAPPLTLPAAQLNLTPESLPYKHLTLDAAHWTLTSTELQSLVSSAIRESAKEQFIRLLPLSVIDTRIPEDLARVERSWDTAAARWRFEAHRRNMLLRALAASGADNDLLTQLSSTLGTLDSHAQDLLHAAAHRTQIAAACDTHRASALAVALRKLNASYARRTRDLDKARANINALRSEVEEAWKVAEEQASEIDRVKTGANSATAQLKDIADDTISGATDDDNALEDDTSDSVLPDGASIDLTMISRAQVIDVTGKAVAAQARLTTVRSDPSSPNSGWSPGGVGSNSSNDNGTARSAGPPPPAFTVPREPPSPATPATDIPLPSSASQVSRVSAARRRSSRKSKASLRLPASIASSTRAIMPSRSRSSLRGEAHGVRKGARSKSRSRKGKDRERDAAQLSWLATDLGGSFLEMEGRPTGEEDADVDGEVDIGEMIGDGVGGSVPPDAESRTAAAAAAAVFSPPPSGSSPPTQAPTGSPRPSTSGIAASLSTLPSPVEASTPIFLPPSDLHYHQVHTAPDPASIFANATTTSLLTTINTTTSTATTTTTTATTATSALDIARRGHSLDIPSSTASAGKHHRHATGAKIRRSISELLSFGSSGSRARRRSLPFTFKGRSNSTRAAPVPGTTDGGSGPGVGSSALRHGSNLNNDATGAEGSEDGWEDTREDEGAAVA